jgi:hypothetical protein
METFGQSQLKFNFDIVASENHSTEFEKSNSNKVIHLSAYIQSKERERIAPIYRKIFESIKHIG